MNSTKPALTWVICTLHRLLTRPKSSGEIIVLTAGFLTVAANLNFFATALEVFEPKPANWPFLISLILSVAALFVLLLSALCHRILVKPVLIAVLLLSAVLAYFTQAYGTVFDTQMIANALETNQAEAADLLTPAMLLWVGLLGILPALVVWAVPLHFPPWRTETMARLKLAGVAVLVPTFHLRCLAVITSVSCASIGKLRIRRCRLLPMLSVARHFLRKAPARNAQHIQIASDAQREPGDAHRELVIMVVGETVRADHWGLNGYVRDTTPKLRAAGVVNFPDFWSCGTSTAISVPCMFSNLGHRSFDRDTAVATDNALDVLARAGVNVLWRDNNSSSKGVADRVTYQDFRTPEINPMCEEGECRDEGMLHELQDWIDQQKGDMLIVLHQMGNHGPAYYKRYPRMFERFTPACTTSDLGSCSAEEVSNAYDNAILYTDDFLSKVIGLLKANTANFETAMFYVSDHGESLGEYGLYLHGTPYALAPDAQRHVPAVLWLGDSIKADIVTSSLPDRSRRRWSHDNVFTTLLGFFEVRSGSYRADLDILEHSKVEFSAQH